MRAESGRGIDEFLPEAEEILEQLTDDLGQLEASAGTGDADAEVINSIFRGAHSLKGISGMFGYAQVTEVSHKTESLLDSLRMGRVRCEPSVVDLLFESVDTLKGLCARLAAGEDGPDPRVAPFVERLLAAAQPGRPAAPPTLADLGLPEETLRVLTDYEVHRLEDTLANAKRQLTNVRVSFSLESFDTDLEALNHALKPCGEIISTLPGTGSSDDRLDFDLLVGAKVSVDELRKVAEPFGATVLVLGRGPAAAPRPSAGETPAAAPPSGPGAPPAPPGPPTSPTRSPAFEAGGDLRSLTKTVRVDLPKLDALMNLVGELVLTKGRFRILGERLREQGGFTGEALELAKAQKEFERKLSELQQAVMDVRMVPLGQVFSKLHRVMKKILQGSTKDADLEIHGAETELDKLIVEDLSDPLIHVIRNALDHGIEEPEVRLGQGKPARGTVTISARQRGNHVVIEVSDDGAGLSKEKIRAKAVEKGLVAPDAVLDDRELFDLIFLPGFSTKEAVTELSGRGVGMDVLRKNIGNLSGMIELSSVEQQGTSVTIVLPITLAIIQALLVEAGGHTYAVPLNSVMETLALEAGHLQSLEGKPVLHLREQTLPLVRITHLFDRRSPSETPEFAVVIGVAERRVAFAVDKLVSQRDVVIKGLGRRLRNLPGIAGATDLGDQRTVLVLDVVALINQVFEGNP